MNISSLFHNGGATGISGFFSAYGSFGAVDGCDRDVAAIQETATGFTADYDSFTAACVCETLENGVVSRQDTFTAKKDLTLNRYTSRLCLEGGEYEVYTQHNYWQTESTGGWQPLVTGVTATNWGIRTTDGAAPMMALRNKGNGKILVLHLLPNAQWQITAYRAPLGGPCDVVIVEAGISDKGLSLPVAAGETVEMPRLFLFEAQSQRDLDAWKLHTVYNRLYPRKALPVLYNTWLMRFDTIDVDHILRQVDTAADIGVELFLIDAGWFGVTDNWGADIGNWTENKVGGFGGRLSEVGDYVRRKGMGFGMWLEPERALTGTPIYKEHPEYFRLGSGDNAFLDFANPAARRYITDVALRLIETYQLAFMKFDFNAPLAYDETGCGFYPYFKGVRAFITELREKHPDLYLTNCASGGYRVELANGMYYDSVWPSDNQSPIDMVRIFKDTALRLPPCHLEKWDVRRFVDGIPQYGNKELRSLPLSCHGATWEEVRNVRADYTYGFLTGGPIGFSTDIAAYPAEEQQALTAHVRQFKADRDFYKTATLRILHEAPGITALQYAAPDLSRVMIQIFTDIPHQETLTVYPVLDETKRYRLEGETLSGATLADNGIQKRIFNIDCTTVELTEEES